MQISVGAGEDGALSLDSALVCFLEPDTGSVTCQSSGLGRLDSRGKCRLHPIMFACFPFSFPPHSGGQVLSQRVREGAGGGGALLEPVELTLSAPIT